MSNAVARINPTIPHDAQQEAIKEISRIHSPELLTNNESFHRMLTEGVKVSYQKDGNGRGDLVWLVDFANPENNDFCGGKPVKPPHMGVVTIETVKKLAAYHQYYAVNRAVESTIRAVRANGRLPPVHR